MAEHQKVTVEQVLRDALHHIRKGWVKKVELDIDGQRGVRGNTVAGLAKLVAEGERVSVCAIGGVFLARALAEPSKRKTAGTFFSADGDPTVAQALRLLAHVVNPKALAANLEQMEDTKWEPDTEVIVFEWNDDKNTSQGQVTRAFNKAIGIAHALGI